MEDLKHCKKCNTTKPLTKEYWHKRKSHHTGWEFYCKECIHKTTRNYYKDNTEKMKGQSLEWKRNQRQKINEYKDPLSCKKCGESRNHLLDFHHINPDKKLFQISQGEAHSWPKVKKEIDKCMVLCSNCHRDFHHLSKKTRILVEDYVSLP